VTEEKSFTDVALDALQDVFYAVDIPNGRLLKWNRAFVEKSGYTDEELSGMTVLDFYDDEGKQRQYEFIAELLEKGHGIIEAEPISKDGRSISYEFRATIVSDPETGEPRAVAGIGRDLTERRATEKALEQYKQALEESEQKFRTIADNSLYGIALVDGTGLVYLNDRVLEITGHPREYFTGTGEVFDLLLPEYRGFFGETLQKLVAGEQVAPYAYVKIYRKSGAVADLLATIKMVYIAGKPVILSTILDITEQRKTEHALRDSEERYRTVLHASPDAVVVVDSAGVLMHVSDYAQELVGYSPDELLGSSAFELVHPRDRDLLRKTIEEVFGGRTVRNLQHRLLRRDGSDVYVETSATVVKDDEGNAILATVVTRDITERRKMENELRDSERRSTMMSQEAETRARELSDVVSIAAHELRHPATIFKAYSELLLSRRDDMGDEVVEQALESMDKASDRLIGLVETLLESSKIESQQMKLTLVESDPALLVSEAVDSFRAEGVTNEFRVEVSGQVVPARMDPEKVIRTLRLLVDNSIKFSPEAAAIGIQVRQSDHQTVFSVSDPGSGIPESSLERVFDRFYQVEDPVHHSKEGMGLGLNIARSMVEAHGGWIRAERRLPAGSVLSFGIPRNQSMPL
jgi:PAS domain S-box-containing protein